jgi:cytochrome c-type biogenesis protein CcmH/NrfG
MTNIIFLSHKECLNSNMSQSECDVITSPVIAHYSGNATNYQKVAMFDKLTNTLWKQVDDGDFDSVASVHYAEARLVEGDESYNKKGSGPSVAMIGGIVVAVAALALAVVGYAFYKKKRADSSAAVAPNNQKSVIQVVAEDVEVVRSHVFGR